MRYLIFICLLIAMPAFGQMNIDWYNSVSSSTYNDITLFWTAESTTLGVNDYSAGDTTPVFNSASIDAAAAKVGTYGLYCPTGYDNATFNVVSDDIVSSVAGRIGFWLRISDYTSVNTTVLFVKDSSNGTLFKVAITTSGNVMFTYSDGANHYYTSSGALTNDTFSFVEVSWDTVNNTRTIYIDGVAETSDTAEINSLTAIDSLSIGVYDGNISGIVSIDNIIISNDPTRDLHLLKDLVASPK